MKKVFDPVVAIDGPCGAGKSTMTSALAGRLGLLYIDTGAMYRALALKVHRCEISFEEGRELGELLKNIKLEYGKSPDCLIEIDGENYTDQIRENQVSIWASKISQLPSVRQYLLDYQRSLVNTKT